MKSSLKFKCPEIFRNSLTRLSPWAESKANEKIALKFLRKNCPLEGTLGVLRLWFYTELHRVYFEVDSVERVTQSVLLFWFKRVKVKFHRKNCPLEGTLGVLQLWFYRRLTDFKWCYGCDFTPSYTEFLFIWIALRELHRAFHLFEFSNRTVCHAVKHLLYKWLMMGDGLAFTS